MTDEPNDLIETLNSTREEEFPEIPKELIKEIVRIEDETLEERELTQDKISDVIESYLEE